MEEFDASGDGPGSSVPCTKPVAVQLISVCGKSFVTSTPSPCNLPSATDSNFSLLAVSSLLVERGFPTSLVLSGPPPSHLLLVESNAVSEPL